MTSINKTWLHFAMDLLAVTDCAGVVDAEINRLKDVFEKSKKKQASKADVLAWNEIDEREDVQARAAFLYGNGVVMPRVVESVRHACWKRVVRYANTNGFLAEKHKDLVA